jgi:DNA-binding NtrC family response regulator
VRELRNIIERAVILEPSNEIQASSIPDFHLEVRLRKAEEPAPISTGSSLDDQMAQYERQVIQVALENNRFNLSKTAEQLKLSRHALRYRMQRLNMTGAQDNEDESEANPGREVPHAR